MRTLHLALLAALAAWLCGCASLPPLTGRTASSALPDKTPTRLGQGIVPATAAHPGRTGILPLTDPGDAFAARVVLAAAADRSLDVQYYIWHDDTTGALLLDALHQAAERGVRVRLLLDDNGTVGIDAMLAALATQPNFEVRLYNPYAQRQARVLGLLGDFDRVNRRMHNKSFTADNLATIVGGRNVGDEYFGAGNAVVFADLDVLAIGPVVAEVSREFDLYWNSASAYPVASLVPAPPPASAQALLAGLREAPARPEAKDYVERVRAEPFVPALIAGSLPLEWTAARVIYDDPAKTLDPDLAGDHLLLSSLLPTIGSARSRFDLVSPYFVPGADGTAALVALARSGVEVRVLTNSLAASDVAAVHAGYAKWRVELLRGGVRLYEFKPSAAAEATRAGRRGFAGSSSAALHAKTFAVDAERIFVGSFNFDPRSARLNTEMGMVLDSPHLAGNLEQAFDTEIRLAAYEVVLDPQGNGVVWIERMPTGEELRHTTEPDTSWWLRSGVGILSVLPIDWLL
ncbi:MAG: phospholipase D family protein [Piscinibacter sp.]|nr:phospholipase D family protein [Piscinibacter sp.]